ncbi:MAG: trypsin-like peptidase domain-containing protein [Acidimicrobiia bacterium]|nr:trypsin-like peptidase domain-containing protein [Acidimicrobiia bacterium]
MGDRFRSEDDNVEKDTAASGDERTSPAEESAASLGNAVNRPVSEPPAPGASTFAGSTPAERPAVFTEWLSDWEDVRAVGTEADPDVADDTAGVIEEESVDPARQTQEIPQLPADTPPDAVASAPAPPVGQPTAVSEAIVDQEPTDPDPAARIPSPPPVHSSPERATTSRQVRASRPRPVSSSSTRATSPARLVGDPRSLRADRFDAIVDPGGGEVAAQARHTTSRTLRVGGLDVTVDATQRAMLVTAAIGMVVVAGLFAFLLSGLGSQTDAATRQADVETVAGLVGPDLNVSASSPAAPSTSDLAQATVRIAGLDDGGQMVCAGSGVLVAEEGVILTNAHVVTIDDECPFTTIAVGVTLDTSDPPELRYRGEVLVVDDALDLAVLRIVGVLSSDDPLEINPNFPVAALGDSDKVDLGDNIGILGYPVIGGETITHTTGTVAGFVREDGKNRALIKTDASISAGSSGGMAVNEAGEVIGIPTRAGANELGPAVDCREVSDTNDDGRVDNDDACVSIGGFLNSIRPINLARDLLSRAEAIQQSAGRSAIDADLLDLSKVSFWNPRFSTGEENDGPVSEVITLTQGVEEICVFVDWSGIPNGVPWAAVWSKDGSKIEEFSIFKIWEYGDEGLNFWYCAEDRRGHPAGVYEVGLFLNNELAFVEAIEVTEEPVETYDVTWVNKSDQDICGLAVNPLAFSRHAGVNVLPPGTVMRPGDSVVVELPDGDIVAEAYDCSGMAIAAELDGLSIPGSLLVDGEQVPFVIGGSTAGTGGTETDG